MEGNRSFGGAFAAARLLLISAGLAGLASCQGSEPADPEIALIEKGRQIFFNETFEGNGRTCSTCHRAEDNFALSPAMIAKLPPDDPLFVAQGNPDLDGRFENPRLLRAMGLIQENFDGFDDLENRFTQRAVPHLLALRTSVESARGPRTGWSGDGAPGNGSLRAFATGAVIQHFTKSLERVAGVDFRLPREDELDALEAFQLSLGRQADLSLPLPLTGALETRGQEIFLDPDLGKCNACHFNAGANGDPAIFGAGAGNLNFDTGIEALPDRSAGPEGEALPPDDGFGTPGDGTFSTPPLVEAADTAPFFHNNSAATIEAAVAFYNSGAFNRSPGGQLLINTTGGGIALDEEQVAAVAAFLRVINALENIRAAGEHLNRSLWQSGRDGHRSARFAMEETADAVMVLSGAGLQSQATEQLEAAERAARDAAGSLLFRGRHVREAIDRLKRARALLIRTESQGTDP